MRIRISLIVLLSIFIGTSIQAQNDFPNGLYLSFEDLVDRKAATEMPYQQRLLSTSGGVTRYELTKEASYKKIKGIFCFVNDNHVYLNCRNYGKKGYFVRSHFSGRYIYFDDIIGKDQFSYSHAATGAAVTSKVWGIVLDMKTGKTMKLSRRNTKKLLKPHSKLYRKYKNGKKTSNEVKVLIEELNGKF